MNNRPAIPAGRTTQRTPAPRPTTGPVPAARGYVLDLQPIHTSTEGVIGLVEFMHLPGNRLMLDGPVRQLRQIVAWYRKRGELVKTSDPVPSDRGAMLTLTFAPAAVAGRTQFATIARVKPWTRRRKVVVFAGVIPGALLTALVATLLWPLPAFLVAAVLLATALAFRRAQRHRSNVPHVAIDHTD